MSDKFSYDDLATPRCPVCRHWLIARLTSSGPRFLCSAECSLAPDRRASLGKSREFSLAAARQLVYPKAHRS